MLEGAGVQKLLRGTLVGADSLTKRVQAGGS